MPNWAIGSMELTGDVTDILNFFCKSFDFVIISEDEEIGGLRVSVRTKERNDLPHLLGTKRCFSCTKRFEIEPMDNGGDVRCEFDIQCAWDIDVDGFAAISKDYNLGVKAYVEECGCGFTHTFECHSGDIVENEWRDCPDEEDESEEGGDE